MDRAPGRVNKRNTSTTLRKDGAPLPDMIRSFGQYICKKAPQDPDLTRKLLLAGYRAFGLKLRVAPDRHLPPARQFSAQYINRTMIRMLSHPEKAALVSIFMPCELLEAMDIVPTGSGAASGAKKALDAALAQAGLSFSDMDAIVTTGYGRETIGAALIAMDGGQ